MSPLHLHHPPGMRPWWQRAWDDFKRQFPDKSGQQARTFLLTILAFAIFMFLTRLYFSSQGIPV